MTVRCSDWPRTSLGGAAGVRKARVRFAGKVYPVQAVEVTNPGEIARILPHFYAKDRDEPSDACRATWNPETCAFGGRFYRLDAPAPSPG